MVHSLPKVDKAFRGRSTVMRSELKRNRLRFRRFLSGYGPASLRRYFDSRPTRLAASSVQTVCWTPSNGTECAPVVCHYFQDSVVLRNALLGEAMELVTEAVVSSWGDGNHTSPLKYNGDTISGRRAFSWKGLCDLLHAAGDASSGLLRNLSYQLTKLSNCYSTVIMVVLSTVLSAANISRDNGFVFCQPKIGTEFKPSEIGIVTRLQCSVYRYKQYCIGICQCLQRQLPYPLIILE
ncbi:hypothetical protein WN48_02005 [Eufriesea mexicana]|nr:hypothetical protein WN48_02005 [Eufriesea mexicana]